MTDSSTPEHEQYDAIIVGARVGGAASAMLMAERGMRVLAVDASAYGSDTRSTHALMRPAVHLLARWGALERIRDAGTPAIRTTTFHYADGSIEVPIKPNATVDALYGPRRTVLDRTLVDLARERGAEVCHGVRVEALLREDDGRVCGVRARVGDGRVRELHAPLVVGADGVRSRVAQWVGSEPYRRARGSTAGFYAYFRGLERPGYHWHFAPGIGAGTIATNDALTLLFVSVTPERFESELRHDREAGFLRAVGEIDPELAERVRGAEREGALHGFPALRGFHRPCAGRGWALVGDAGYFRDPLTAHGITDAFRDAELLAQAAAIDTTRAFAEYQVTRDELTVPFSELTDEIAGLRWSTERAKTLHKQLSREMVREQEFVELVAPAPEVGLHDPVRMTA